MNTTNYTGSDEPFTIDKLREAMKLLPQPIGYALLKGSNLVGYAYRIENTLKLGEHKFMLVVPNHFLQQAVEMTRATPSQEIKGAYEYPIYSLLKNDIC